MMRWPRQALLTALLACSVGVWLAARCAEPHFQLIGTLALAEVRGGTCYYNTPNSCNQEWACELAECDYFLGDYLCAEETGYYREMQTYTVCYSFPSGFTECTIPTEEVCTTGAECVKYCVEVDTDVWKCIPDPFNVWTQQTVMVSSASGSMCGIANNVPEGSSPWAVARINGVGFEAFE
jgi:hypothetical protein